MKEKTPKERFESYVREKCPELVEKWKKHNCGFLSGCKCTDDDLEERIKNYPIQLHHVLRVLDNFVQLKLNRSFTQGKEWLVVSNETKDVWLPLTPPSEWSEDVYKNLCEICDV